LPVVYQKIVGAGAPAAGRASTFSMPAADSMTTISQRLCIIHRSSRSVHSELVGSTETMIDSPAEMLRVGRIRMSRTAADEPVGTH
jgi:hypothetical protein